MKLTTHERWKTLVASVIKDWYERDEDLVRLAPAAWDSVCGLGGTTLETALAERDGDKVLLLLYRLVTQLKDYEERGEMIEAAEHLASFLEDMHHRLRVPELETKHLWAAGEWHDYPQSVVQIFLNQDLSRARLCIKEIEAGEYRRPYSRQWPWK